MSQSSQHKWYTLRIKGKQEEKIKKSLEEVFQKENAEDIFDKIILPFEEKYVIRRSKKQIVKRYFAYLCICMNIQDKRALRILRSVEGVYGFVGLVGWGDAQTSPTPVPASEINDMLSKVNKSDAQQKVALKTFIKGEEVKIINGAFAGNTATIIKVSGIGKKINASIKVFGKPTTILLDYNQIM